MVVYCGGWCCVVGCVVGWYGGALCGSVLSCEGYVVLCGGVLYGVYFVVVFGLFWNVCCG